MQTPMSPLNCLNTWAWWHWTASWSAPSATTATVRPRGESVQTFSVRSHFQWNVLSRWLLQLSESWVEETSRLTFASVLISVEKTHTSKQCTSSVIWLTCGSDCFRTTTTSFSTSAHMASGTEKHAGWLTVIQVSSEHIIWLMAILNSWQTSITLDLIHLKYSTPIHCPFCICGWYFTHCCSRISLQILTLYLAFWRESHKKEERRTEGREGAGPHTGQEKPGLSGHPSPCKSMLCDFGKLDILTLAHCNDVGEFDVQPRFKTPHHTKNV